MISEKEYNLIKLQDVVEFTETDNVGNNYIYFGKACFLGISNNSRFKNLKIVYMEKSIINGYPIRVNGPEQWSYWREITDYASEIFSELLNFFSIKEKLNNISEISEKYIFKSFNIHDSITNYQQILSIKSDIQSNNKYGYHCLKCNEYNKDAMANCKNDQFMCYSCRSWNLNKFEEYRL